MKTLGLAFALAFTTVLASTGAAQFMLPPAKEMKQLDWMNGSWTGTISYTMPGMKKEPIPSAMKVEDVNRGLHKRMTYTIDMGGKGNQYEGTTYVTWVEKDKAFKAWTFENMVSEPRIELGTFADSKLAFTSEPHGGSIVTRSTFTKKSDSEMGFAIEMKQGEKWIAVGNGSYKKDPSSVSAK